MIIIKIINVVYPIMFFLRRQVKKCKIHKKLKLRMNGDGVKCQMGTELSGF